MRNPLCIEIHKRGSNFSTTAQVQVIIVYLKLQDAHSYGGAASIADVILIWNSTCRVLWLTENLGGTMSLYKSSASRWNFWVILRRWVARLRC